MTPRSLIIAVAILLAASLGMGAYVWHIRRVVVAQAPASETQAVAPPVSGPTEQVTLYIAYDSPGVLLPEAASLPMPQDRQQRARELLRVLISKYLEKGSPHALAAGSDVRDVYLLDPGLAVIDFNAELANGHRSGVLAEELTLASAAQTLSMNVAGISSVKFLVDGKERETLAGHADLTEIYDVSHITQMVSALGASE
jgi:hypothetical protein